MLKQHLQFKLSQKLSPQQIQLMKLIQLPTLQFEQRVAQEMEENPALEGGKDNQEETDDLYSNEEYEQDNERIDTDDINIDEYLSDDEVPDYKLHSNNYSADDEEKSLPYASGISFPEYLTNQISTSTLNATQLEIAQFIIGSLDKNGYLNRPIKDLVDDLAFTQNLFVDEKQVESVLQHVQDLDPAGVGARNLQECLLLQIERKSPTASVMLALTILDEYFEPFSKKHYDKLIHKLEVTPDELRLAIHEIEKLNPKPGGSYAENHRTAENILPDFTIRIIEGELELTLNGRNAPELFVSKEYKNMLDGYKEASEKSKSQKDAVQFIKQKLDAAKWFIDAIKQRQQTLYVTMNCIMHYQKEYFLSGDERNLKPMILKDIADQIGMDISTVSRVANSKYVDTPYGIKLVKDFFSEAMKNDQGEDVSTREIKKILEITIQEEDKKKPLTDDKLAEILKEKGYPIARRTIAKYREQLDIPVARMRKEL